jgi:molybdate transport system substrate-binding protein
MKSYIFRLVLVSVVSLTGTSSRSAELTIAAAADLKFAMDQIVTEFQTKQPGTTVKVAFGSSGNFFAQLQNRAPFDLYFSADIEYPRKLAEAGHALDTNVFLYAVGRLVVWVPRYSSVDLGTLGIQSLLEPSVRKVAIANPEHAPYGRAAITAMKSLHVYEQAESKLVYGENIAQTAQFIQSGAADAGLIALSLALAMQTRDRGRYWEIPRDAYPKIEQGGIILSWTKEPIAARRFRDFVLGQHGREVLKRYGFFLPEK